MIGRPASFLRGSQIPPQDAIVAPGASSTFNRDTIRGRTPRHEQSAMEMSALWKPQNGFHSTLEISHSTRDSHISTAAPCVSQQDDDEEHDERPAASLTTAGQLTFG